MTTITESWQSLLSSSMGCFVISGCYSFGNLNTIYRRRKGFKPLNILSEMKFKAILTCTVKIGKLKTLLTHDLCFIQYTAPELRMGLHTVHCSTIERGVIHNPQLKDWERGYTQSTAPGLWEGNTQSNCSRIERGFIYNALFPDCDRVVTQSTPWNKPGVKESEADNVNFMPPAKLPYIIKEEEGCNCNKKRRIRGRKTGLGVGRSNWKRRGGAGENERERGEREK